MTALLMRFELDHETEAGSGCYREVALTSGTKGWKRHIPRGVFYLNAESYRTLGEPQQIFLTASTEAASEPKRAEKVMTNEEAKETLTSLAHLLVNPVDESPGGREDVFAYLVRYAAGVLSAFEDGHL